MGWDAVEKVLNQEDDFQKVEFINFSPGKASTIRVIGDKPIQRWKHWVQMHSRSYICPGKGCPICEINNKAKANGGEAKYNNQYKHHILVVDKDDSKVKILENSSTFFGDLNTLRKEVGDLDTYDIKVIRNGKGRDTTYSLIPIPGTELTEEEQKNVEATDIDLEEYFRPPTPEQLTRLLAGEDPDDVFQSEEEVTGDSEEIEVDFTNTGE